jgi:TPR repeat protein
MGRNSPWAFIFQTGRRKGYCQGGQASAAASRKRQNGTGRRPTRDRDYAIQSHGDAENGEVVATAADAAMRLYAKQGVPEAQLRLGDCYAAGHVFDRDLEMARGWYAAGAG